MERKANINANNSLASFFTTEEIELSKVLLQLSYPVFLSEHKHNVWKVGWGSTKKRSIPPSEPNNVALVCCRPPPLPRDSGEKPPKSSKPRRRRREHWLEKINELTERRELLKKEVGKVGAYYEKLKAINSELKARKQELKPTLIMDIPADVDVSNEVKSQRFDLDVAKKILTKAMCA